MTRYKSSYPLVTRTSGGLILKPFFGDVPVAVTVVLFLHFVLS